MAMRYGGLDPEIVHGLSMRERHFSKWPDRLILVPGLSMDCPVGEALCKIACWTDPGPRIIHGLLSM